MRPLRPASQIDPAQSSATSDDDTAATGEDRASAETGGQPRNWPQGSAPHPRPADMDSGPVERVPIVSSGRRMRRPITEQSQYARDMAALEVQFERALGAIQMVFQPIVHAADHGIFGYEALLRSRDEDLPHPGALLDAAERLNRLSKLGRHIRHQVATIFAEADDSRGLVFVNLHALDLLDKSLSSQFSPLAKIARRVVLEVTERASLEAVDDIRYRVAELREMGYRIAIDDLGAGHARMHQFSPLDTDLVKLDMSVVRDIDSHPMKQQLVASIIGLCKDQGILVIGEGVETAAEADYLTESGCDLLQGYFIGRPAPPFATPPKRAV